MNRQEFCDMLAEAKRDSGVSTSELSFSLKMLLPSLRRLETGKHNFSVAKIMEYLSLIKYHLAIGNNNFYKYEELVGYIKEHRKQYGSLSKTADAIGVSKQGISNIEVQRSVMSIDIFLSLVKLFGSRIEIKPNQHK